MDPRAPAATSGRPASRVKDKERAMTPNQSPFGVHLKSAVLCVETECSTVFNSRAARTCPRCGSSACYPISIWLDRVERVDAARIVRPREPHLFESRALEGDSR